MTTPITKILERQQAEKLGLTRFPIYGLGDMSHVVIDYYWADANQPEESHDCYYWDDTNQILTMDPFHDITPTTPA